MSAESKRGAAMIGAGCLCGLAAIAMAWTVASQPLGLFHLPAMLAVLLAATSLTLIGARPSDWEVLHRPQADGLALAAARQRLVQLAVVSRADGPRGLERQLGAAQHPIERQGLSLLVDGCAVSELQATLEAAAASAAEQDQAPTRVWRLLSAAFVNAGIVVTLVGMVHTLLANQAQGPEPGHLAGALTAAVYGIVLGLGVFQPAAGRARLAGRAQSAVRRCWIEGLVAIADGVHPRRLADRWNLESDTTPLLRSVA